MDKPARYGQAFDIHGCGCKARPETGKPFHCAKCDLTVSIDETGLTTITDRGNSTYVSKTGQFLGSSNSQVQSHESTVH